MTFSISSDFGFIVFVVIASIFLLQWLGHNVFTARKTFEVPYPKMYADHCHEFNCIQRAHQNTLEVYPVFLVLLIFGGLAFPKLSAACGVIWMISRVVYAFGYYTGDPAKRNRGAFGYIGLLVLLVNTVLFALGLLGVI